ncbi:hypothetical protein [Streptomyces roseolus]|uniref:hypothetical protein n=1 Tax=Streptomyces roseolus TaxID=67358 RepID=UPI0036F0CD0E
MYKETARGGLAVNIIDVLKLQALISAFASFSAVRAFPAYLAESPWNFPGAGAKTLGCPC